MQAYYPSGVVSTYHLPLRATPRTDHLIPHGSQQTGDSVRKPSKHRRALVVDDIADVTEMLSVVLTHAGYEVITASSASEALEVAANQRFDVVISDIGMPRMDGYQLAQALRVLPGYDAVPMVAVTGYAMFDDKSKSINAGFNAHMTKPIDPRSLLDLIEHL
jgi:CheY-like chemotaxis protein